MTEIPKGFRYQGVDWRIDVSAELSEASKTWGRIVRATNVIQLEPDQASVSIRITLWHEVMHVVGLVFQQEDEPNERQVRILSEGLFGLLADNPDLRRYIWP